MKKIRSILHRWAAARLHARAARLQLDLDDLFAMEQTRINRLHARAIWHEEQREALAPAPSIVREPSRPFKALGRGLTDILSVRRAA
jgi:DNA-binding PucR family transcriptional regulator